MSLRILVAEDDNLNQLVILEMLKICRPEAEVVIVNNGQEALDCLAVGSYDVLLTDIAMPRMDGHELARRVKQDLKLDLPVVSVTAFAVAGDRERLLMQGFDDYISKPVNLDALDATLGRVLSLKVNS